ncbi:MULTISPECIES: polysaccharide deacetylase family protein [unclassified Sphingomonas]|uniref:polysaccharide deacetylase family protein n=1 Tax=unclassified Sphingomonas TaxID=196159 RepID=UPI000700CC23|nr:MULTISPECIES: polysaccharide deacetylase family protein [unclassified Sphingomonas]KQM24540.1 polysaccharide deacetylase [Sphingomonas sp. Leaf9]KQM42199.1 polysaccharide deacetylase [Sphingomonas sp. Leaf11]
MMRRLIAAILLSLAAITPAAAQKRIALTFDDAPRARGPFLTPDERTARLIVGLRKAKVRQAAFFVVPGNLAAPDGVGGERRIAAYVKAGHVIANHSFSHPALKSMTAEAYLADIDRASGWLMGRKGLRPWFRFPFLDEGGTDKAKRDAVRAGLAARKLSNGYVTVDGSDWNIEGLTLEARKAGKPVDMDALRDLYVETHVESAEFSDRLAKQALGRQPVQVMLLHETDLAAYWIADLVAALRKKGWEIVTADVAYRDPIARAQPDTPSAQGNRLEAMAWEKGVPAPRWYERNTLSIATPLYRRRVLYEAQ